MNFLEVYHVLPPHHRQASPGLVHQLPPSRTLGTGRYLHSVSLYLHFTSLHLHSNCKAFTFYLLTFSFYLLTFTFYLLTFTFYLLTFTFSILTLTLYLLTFTFCLLHSFSWHLHLPPDFQRRIRRRSVPTSGRRLAVKGTPPSLFHLS